MSATCAVNGRAGLCLLDGVGTIARFSVPVLYSSGSLGVRTPYLTPPHLKEAALRGAGKAPIRTQGFFHRAGQARGDWPSESHR